MAKKHTTKRSLVASALVLTLCCTSLVGTTFAWFTDSVENKGNVIQTGSLEIDLEVLDATDGKTWTSVQEMDGPIFDYTNWEPGYVQSKVLRVENEGTLALKWMARLVSDAELSTLADVIDVFVLPYGVLEDDSVVAYPTRELENYTRVGTLTEFVDTIEVTTRGELEAGETAYLGIAFQMQESAGNEYQAMDLGGAFDLQILATQVSSESDSFGDDYDNGAYFPIVFNESQLSSALEQGASVKLANDITVTETISIPAAATSTLDLNGKTISTDAKEIVIENAGELTVTGGTVESTLVNGSSVITNTGSLVLDGATVKGAPIGETGWPAYAITTSGELTIDGGSYVYSDRGVLAMNDGANVTINDGEFIVSDALDGRVLTAHVIYAYGYNSELTINDGYFALEYNAAPSTGASVICPAGAKINVYGGNFEYKGQTGSQSGIFQNYMGYGVKLNVCGGTYNDTTVKKNLAAGYAAVDNLDGTYTVLPAVEGKTLTGVQGYAGLYTDGANDFYIFNAQGLESFNAWCGDYNANMRVNYWGKTYNIMADIDASDVTWNTVYANMDSAYSDGITFNGKGHTISNLNVTGSAMFDVAAQGNADGTLPTTFKDLTLDNVTVSGDANHFAGVIWSQCYNGLVFENVTIKNCSVTGKCNVGAFVGGTAGDAVKNSLTFKNCAVENTKLTAKGTYTGIVNDWASDPTGANVYVGRAFATTPVTFENCTESNNVVTNNESLTGGGIYGYTTISNGWWCGTGASDTFTNWNGLTVVENVESVKTALTESTEKEVMFALPAESTITLDNGDTANKDVTFVGDKSSTVAIESTAQADGGGLYYQDNANLTFQGITFDASQVSGICARGGVITFTDCHITGEMVKTIADKFVFKGCTFDVGVTQVGYGCNDVVFEDCAFETDGYGIKIYCETSTAKINLTIKNCSFKNTGDAAETAILIDHIIAGISYNITVEGCTFEGYTAEPVSRYNQWAPRMIMTDSIVKTADGQYVFAYQTGAEDGGYYKPLDADHLVVTVK